MEATESATTVLQYYNELLEADSSNAVSVASPPSRNPHTNSQPNKAAWKRRISVVRRMGRTEKAIDELSQYLDTFYTDVEGWLELADVYSSCNQYVAQALRKEHTLMCSLF